MLNSTRMPFISCLVRLALPLILLAGAAGAMHPRGALATRSASDGMIRYGSAAYGYRLLAPASWVRLGGVHWTPAGPAADLTLMTPDHQAALGVIVAPTGGRHYSDTELRDVALRLLYQENYLLNGMQIQQQRIVVNNVGFQAVAAVSYSGYPAASQTAISVWVTQRHNRLYALAGLVYHQVDMLPAGGGDTPTPTPTPDTGFGAAPDSYLNGMAARPVAAPSPAAGLAAPARRLDAPAGPPAPLPTDHLRGNLCPTPGDGGLVFADRNCAFAAEQQMLVAIRSSFAFTLHAADDRRPAAKIGVDGFALASNTALGFRVEYPAQWRPVAIQNMAGGVESPDQTTLVTLEVQRTGPETLAPSDLQSAAYAEIAQVSNGAPSNVSYQTRRVNGILYLQALSPLTNLANSSGVLELGQVSFTVASYHHRLYSLRGIAVRPATVAGAPSVYPYFSPFTALARAYQNSLDLEMQEAELALQATGTLYVDPHVLEA